jgi:microcystin degradation protein MlrC
MTRAAQPRVLVGRLFHESHAFSPFVTRVSEFAVTRGADLLDEARTSGTTLGGIVRRLDRLGAHVVASVSASAPPSGLVDHAFYRSIKDELIDAAIAATPDAIALELHGAMGTTDLPDVEGDLLAALRSAVGPDVVIGVGLDLHGHLTPAMLAAADFCIACKANPHADVVDCGEKVAAGVMSALEGTFAPVSTLVKVLMTLPGAMETTAGPLKALHEEARALAASSPLIWDISLYNVYRALDDVDMGQAVCVVTNGDGSAAAGIAKLLAHAFWDRRDEFKDDLLEIEAALDLVARERGRERFVLADMGDRVLAGAPGDSNAILAATLAHPAPLKGAIPLTDAETVAAAHSAGVGSALDVAVGGKLTPGFAPQAVRARVARLSDGNFRMRGPYRGGEWTALGPCAVLDIGGRISLLVTSKPGFTHDPEAFESNGIPLLAQDFIVVKSGYHFELNFKGLATPLLLRSPGIGYYTKGLTTWKRGRFWPEHDVGDAPLVGPQIFHRQARVTSGAEHGRT